MVLNVVGQRCVSEREPELGLGVVVGVERTRIGVEFPASGERRLYAAGTGVLKRVEFAVGETVTARDGTSLVVESVSEDAGLLVYVGKGGRQVREDVVSDAMGLSLPQERFMAGQAEKGEVFDLRRRALEAQARFRGAEVRGYLGGRIDLIPHQFYLLHEVSSRQAPRVLLSDEVGLGKTIEACLIVQRMLVTGRAGRVLILVPETLVHQWFVELWRRFNLWFSIFDEERCVAAEASEPGKNPFLEAQWGLASTGFLAGNGVRREQAVEAGWDVLVVDEAHHLTWSPEEAGAEYKMVEELAGRTPGLLLLTATPTQTGAAGHFARLRLLDPSRYTDYAAFRAEAEAFEAVAAVAEKVIERKPLKPRERTALKRIFKRDPERLEGLLAGLEAGGEGAWETLLRTLLDEHGTGRVMFRNTRAAMSGFPKRRYCPVVLEVSEEQASLVTRVGVEMLAEETGQGEDLRYGFKDDPRVGWLVDFLQKRKGEKVLLIGKTQRKVLALEAALQERTGVKIGVFHEGLALVQRDRNAAWFAEPDGAQVLLCSEIGSEGRNFQFAHHLVLFDLPLNPGLLEQRIGRLDRIGQTSTIQLHVPVIRGGADEAVARWYDEGLDAFRTPLHGGNEYREAFGARLLGLVEAQASRTVAGRAAGGAEKWASLIEETAAFREALLAKFKRGRDRLLELNSFNPEVAERVIAKVRAADEDPFTRNFLIELLDHFGVRVREDETGELFLDASHAYVEGFPAIPRDGLLATFDRKRAMVRDDICFLSADHGLVRDAMDLLINSTAGTTAFGEIEADEPNLLLEAIYVLEAVAERRWQVDRFLSPQPVRVLIDIRSRDLTEERSSRELAEEVTDGDLAGFLARPGFNAVFLKAMLEGAEERAQVRAAGVVKAATERAEVALGAELQRLLDLQRINDHVRAEEIELAREQLERTGEAIRGARLRLDALRVVVEGPGVGRG